MKGVKHMIEQLKLEYFDLIAQRKALKETLDELHNKWEDVLSWDGSDEEQAAHWEYARSLEIKRVDLAIRQQEIRLEVGKPIMREWRTEWYTMREEGRLLVQ